MYNCLIKSTNESKQMSIVFVMNTMIPVMFYLDSEANIINATVFLNNPPVHLENDPTPLSDKTVISSIPLYLVDSDEQFANYFADNADVCALYKNEFTELRIFVQ